MHALFRRPCSSASLLDSQVVALADLCDAEGGFHSIDVGGGKTLISFLAPAIYECTDAVLLVPTALLEKTVREWNEYNSDWRLPPLRPVAIEHLSGIRGRGVLEELKPSLIVVDEAQAFKKQLMSRGALSARTKRLGRYIAQTEPRIVAMSGTFMSKSLTDAAHLAVWALGEQAPVPRNERTLVEWAKAVDPDVEDWERPRPGALEKWGEDVRAGVAARIWDTPGCVRWSGQGCPASLRITLVEVDLGAKVREAQSLLESSWVDPIGRWLNLPVDVWRIRRQIAQGFVYYFDPPPPEHWTAARADCAAFIGGLRGFDSWGEAVRQHKNHPAVQRWLDVRGEYALEKNRKVHWLSKKILSRATKWGGGLIWCNTLATGQALAEHGIPYLGAGDGHKIVDFDGDCVALSEGTFRRGHNLQRFSRNLILQPGVSASNWEQLLGRTHRRGQTADVVEVDVFITHSSARKDFQRALERAEMLRQFEGRQRLLIADILEK